LQNHVIQRVTSIDFVSIFNPNYALELRYEKLKCNKSAIYIRKA